MGIVLVRLWSSAVCSPIVSASALVSSDIRWKSCPVQNGKKLHGSLLIAPRKGTDMAARSMNDRKFCEKDSESMLGGRRSMVV